LSRFLLALKVCLTGDAPGLTMIFDEIDRGVGGAPVLQVCAVQQGGCFAEEVVAPAAATWLLPGAVTHTLSDNCY